MPVYDEYGRPVDEQDPRTGLSRASPPMVAPPFPMMAGPGVNPMGPGMAPPMPPGGPMMGPPPQQMGQPQQPGGMNAALNSPSAAMLGQALNNLATMRRGGAPSQSPFDAYQRQVMAQTTSRLAEEQNMRQQKILERGDPYYEYTEGKRRGILPPDMTWEQFNQAKFRALAGDTSNIRDLNRIIELRRPKEEGETDEQYKERLNNATLLENLAVNPLTYNLGGGGVGVSSGVRPGQSPLGAAPGAPVPDGSGPPLHSPPGVLVPPAVSTANEAALAGAKETATDWAKIDADWQTGFHNTYPKTLDAARKVNDLLTLVEQNPDMDTGILEGQVSPYVDEIVAYMDTMSSLLTVPSLAAAKLAPVTVQEWEAIKNTFANAKRDPAANIGALKASYNDMIGILERMAAIQQHYVKSGTTRGFGMDTEAGGDIPKRREAPGGKPQNINGGDLIEIPGID